MFWQILPNHCVSIFVMWCPSLSNFGIRTVPIYPQPPVMRMFNAIYSNINIIYFFRLDLNKTKIIDIKKPPKKPIKT